MSKFLEYVDKLVKNEKQSLTDGVSIESVRNIHNESNCGLQSAKNEACLKNRLSIKDGILKDLDQAENMIEIKLILGRIIHRLY